MTDKRPLRTVLWVTGAAAGILLLNVLFLWYGPGSQPIQSVPPSVKPGDRSATPRSSPENETARVQPITTVRNKRTKGPNDVRVFGTAVDRNGVPLDDCLISIGPRWSQFVNAFEIGPNGEFEGFGPPGECNVGVYRKWPSTPAGPRVDAFDQRIIELKGEELRLDIRSEKAYEDFTVPES